MMACPVCGGPVPLTSFGRPPVYCSPEHRREMTQRRRTISDLEGQIVEARTLADHGFWPGRDHWQREAKRLQRVLDGARAGVPEEMQ